VLLALTICVVLLAAWLVLVICVVFCVLFTVMTELVEVVRMVKLLSAYATPGPSPLAWTIDNAAMIARVTATVTRTRFDKAAKSATL